MNKLWSCIILAIIFSIIHNLYLFQQETNEDDGEYVRENDYFSFGQSNDLSNVDGFEQDGFENPKPESSNLGAVAFLTQLLWTGPVSRVKRRIWFSNETLPIPPEELDGNATSSSGGGGGNGSADGNSTGRTKPKGYSIIKLLNKQYFVVKEKYLKDFADGIVDIHGKPLNPPTAAPGATPGPGGPPAAAAAGAAAAATPPSAGPGAAASPAPTPKTP